MKNLRQHISQLLSISFWFLNQLAPKTTGQNLAKTFSNSSSWIKNIRIEKKISLNLIFDGILRGQHWAKYWLGERKATRNYLNKCWPRSRQSNVIPRPQSVNHNSMPRPLQWTRLANTTFNNKFTHMMVAINHITVHPAKLLPWSGAILYNKAINPSIPGSSGECVIFNYILEVDIMSLFW